MALSLALIRDTVPPEKIGTAMGLMGTMSAVGTALGPSLGGLLLAGPGWHAIFLIVVPLGLVNTVLVLRTIPAQDARVTDTRPRLDGWGTLFLAGALGSYALAVTIGNGTLNWLNIGLISASALAIGVFIRVEKTAPAPLIELSALRNLSLSTGLITNFCVVSILSVTGFGPECGTGRFDPDGWPDHVRDLRRPIWMACGSVWRIQDHVPGIV